MENTITIPVSTLEELIRMNESDVAIYRSHGMETMASWAEGKASGYRTLLTVYGS